MNHSWWWHLWNDPMPSKERSDAHQLHVLRLKRQRAAQPSKLPWRWKLADEVKPCPGEVGQG